jgi:cytochrome c oxidase subunit 3
MTVTLVFLALLMAGFVAWLLVQSINVRPWVAESGKAGRTAYLPSGATAPRVALAVFLAVVTSIFALTISAYLMRMGHGAGHHSDWKPLPEPGLLWVNTGILLLGSIALQLAWEAAKRGNKETLQLSLLAGGACTIAFIGGQYLVWQQLNAAGYYLSGNPANSFFYLLTALHALHLLGGLVAWGRILMGVQAGAAPPQVRGSVELCAIYWHFLFAVWLALFALLLST